MPATARSRSAAAKRGAASRARQKLARAAIANDGATREPSLGPVDRRSFARQRRELLTPVQRVIRDADQTLGNSGGLVDVAIDIARAWLAGDEAKAAETLTAVRERRRSWVERIARELVEAAS